MVKKHLPAVTFTLLCFATVSPVGSASADEKIDAEVWSGLGSRADGRAIDLGDL